MGYINGVIFPVKVSAEDYAKLKSASNFDKLGFTELTEVPAVYKELTVDNGVLSFSEAEGKTETVDANYTFSTSSKYGDYQISFSNVNDIFNDNVVYGVVLETAEGDDYGLYSQENIWKTPSLHGQQVLQQKLMVVHFVQNLMRRLWVKPSIMYSISQLMVSIISQ